MGETAAQDAEQVEQETEGAVGGDVVVEVAVAEQAGQNTPPTGQQ